MEFVDYKCLESLLIEGEDLIATEFSAYPDNPDIVSVNFFNEMWKAKVWYNLPEDRLEEGKAALKSFVRNSKSISSKIESQFCKEVMDIGFYYDLVEDNIVPETLTKYSEIPGLTLGFIEVTTTYKSRSIVVCPSGGFEIDPEHGWALAFLKNKWIGHLSETGAIHNEYAKY